MEINELAAIEYHGSAGISRHCKQAVVRLIHFSDKIEKATILSSSGTHCLLLNTEFDILIAIKSGFGSGYAGEGSAAFATVLKLLERHGAEIDEVDVPKDLLRRLDASCLTCADIDWIEQATPVRPFRWYDYLDMFRGNGDERLNDEFPASVPFQILDPRLTEIALGFQQDPDKALVSGFRKLESIVRTRTGLDEANGTKLFSKTFLGDEPILTWEGIDPGEKAARGTLFSSIFTAFRNRRMHHEPDPNSGGELQEFLMLNQLFLLEREAQPAPLLTKLPF